MLVVVGLGVAGFFQQYPVAHSALKFVSAVYMFWLALNIAKASAPEETAGRAKPMTFFQAALFQWVNPKAWSMALTTVTLYSSSQNPNSLFIVAGIFALVNLPAVGSWAYLGQNIRLWLASPVLLRCFNWGMAILLIGSLAVMF